MQPPRVSVPVNLPTRPESIQIDLATTAVIVVDMQNAFMSPKGMFDVTGWPIDGAQRVIEPSRKLIEGARERGVKVVYVKMSYNADMSNAGGPDSPNWHKETGMVHMTKHPEDWGRFVTEGTWDEQVIDRLAPLPGEPVVRKHRYSGFAGTSLDHVLKTLGARYLLFIGGATNICVETTLMDGFFLDYWPILVEDACFSQCPAVAVEGVLAAMATA